MYDKILVPLDGSELAEVTLWYAARLAARMSSSITLLYVDPPTEVTSPHMYECYLKDMIVRVKTDADKYAAEMGRDKVTVDYKIIEGDPSEEIIDYADKAKTDLIILSTQGKSGVTRWALGNVANKVVRATRKQVLLIRAKGPKVDVYRDRLSKILVPVDGSKESESILRFVTYMAKESDLEITLLHICIRIVGTYYSPETMKQMDKSKKQGIDYLRRLGARIEKQGLNVKTMFREDWLGNEAEAIIKIAEEGKFSLVAMATHGRSGVGRWIFGSNADRVLNEGNTPLLLVRPTKRKKKAD